MSVFECVLVSIIIVLTMELLICLKCKRGYKKPKVRAIINSLYVINNQTLLLENTMETVLRTNQGVEYTIGRFVDEYGNNAPVDGAPVWESLNPDVITLTPAADGMSCKAEATGSVGATQIKMTADADTGEGVVTIETFIDISVIAGQAVGAEIIAGTPYEIE